MNPIVRLFLALFFAIALPVNGMAQTLMQTGAAGSGNVQSVDHHMHATIDSDEMQATMAMAACDDHDSNTQVCDSGQECKTSGLLQLHFAKSDTLPPGQPPLVASVRSVPLPLSEPLWHPPRS